MFNQTAKSLRNIKCFFIRIDIVWINYATKVVCELSSTVGLLRIIYVSIVSKLSIFERKVILPKLDVIYF